MINKVQSTPLASVNFLIMNRRSMNLRAELKRILHDVGPESIWRPVYDNENVLLADGIAEMSDARPQDISTVDFQGKTVLDLGCNFGFYSFLAKRLGARKVVGIDYNDQIIRGCRLLKAMYGVRDVHFYMADLANSNLPGPFDIAILINYIGKKEVRRGITKVLDAVERVSLSTMIISLAYSYRIDKHLDRDTENLIRRYPPVYIRDGELHLIEFVHDYFRDNWSMAVISPEYETLNDKRTLLFTRK
ncbi:MAG: methyltransferase domain-containing protein [Deltaproteobacteria bacterium]|nr:MAG: methyltransferase domain-containing protein [Deltaproteobacteria bacterium]